MTLKKIPEAPEARPCAQIQSELMPLALERWNPAIRAASQDDTSISIYDPIGMDWWTGEGVTAKRISAALRSIGDRDVTVLINSPGGDVFEGLAIYNLLREHPGKVTVKVLGLAASAASFIAMAADELQIARAGFLMIHNAWTVAAGDRQAFREAADFLEMIDGTLADIYAARTGEAVAEVSRMMDAESWFGGTAAIEAGFADRMLDSDEAVEDARAASPHQIAARRLDTALAKAGMPRSERRSLIQEIKTSTPRAAGSGTPGATENLADLADQTAELERALAQFSAAANAIRGTSNG